MATKKTKKPKPAKKRAPLGEPVSLTTREAFSEAKRRIGAAIGAKDPSLNLSGLSNLKKIPDIGTAAFTSINLAGTQVTNLAPLASLSSLRTLNLTGTPVRDISALAQNSDLRFLYLDNTQVSDLTPISNLSHLETLQLTSTPVTDLDPLRDVRSLKKLLIGNTKVSSLDPLKELKKLIQISLWETRITDLEPVRGLTNLKFLYFGRTAISDLSPLTDHTKLRGVSAYSTKVTELNPLANSVHLIESARRFSEEGLDVTDCPLKDKTLRDFSKLSNPSRTRKILAYLRRKQGLPAYDADSAANADELSPPAIPKLPSQGPGPRFALRNDGIIGLRPVSLADQEGNDTSRLRRLHQPLKDAARDLVSSLTGNSSNTYGTLFTRASTYAALIDQPVDQIDYAILYAAGLRLENARAAAEREIKDNIIPPLEDHQFEALKSLSTLHGVFISATSEGQALLSDAERFDMGREEIETIKREILDVIRPLVDEDQIVEPAIPQGIVDILNESAPVNHPERRTTYSYAATSNLMIVLTGYAALGMAFGATDWAHAAGIFAGTGAHAALSKRGKDARKFAILLATDATNFADKKLQEVLRRGSTAAEKYILAHEKKLRALAKRSARFNFISDFLDWLKSRPPPNPIK